MNDKSLSDERLAEFKEAFEIFDQDKDGYISIERIIDILREIGHDIQKEDIKHIVKELKVINGKINFEEFIKIMAYKTRDSMIEEEIIEAFKVFDKKGDGKINWEEIKFILKGNMQEDISDEELTQIIKCATNDGEYICYEELVKNNVDK